MRILVTNDDGIDSVGLHHLARAMVGLGEVVVVAPDAEYSGAGAAMGALHLIQPEVRAVRIDGVDTAWAVTGPPALCVMFGRLGAFDGPFDLVVSGINPGVNAGRAVYHSGTVGACLTARNGGISSVAVSQAGVDLGVEGQSWDDMLLGQKWDVAATIGRSVVASLVAEMPVEPVVLNVNVPNLDLEAIKGWRRTEVALLPPRALASASLEPKVGHDGAFHVRMEWGDPIPLPAELDGGAVEAGYVSVTPLSRILDDGSDMGAIASSLDQLWA